ncbi:hypothetical protein QQZ08_008947 [Neonectria magnoliae]|uniref:MARVEL domain-containing protein n=1 Tax=Neonectria magnoliae TaxID=2732573 RepID=A0ABR1HRH8_9HYPO
MGGSQPPFMYSAVQRNDARFPETIFDPKAVTRASWEPKKPKPKPDGPLVSFNRHPDAHMVLSYRSNNYSSLSPRTKNWVKWLRYFQLLLRILELVGAVGILVLMILTTKVEAVTGWILRITPAVVTAHCLYAIYHLSRDSSGRPPASSAAYHLFSAMTDVAAAPIYAFCALTVHKKSDSWKTVLADQNLMDTFRPVVYYTLIAVASLHLASLSNSLWLGWMFRKISFMPPDMNPLEDNLTARPKHKKAKSSTSTLSTMDTGGRLSTARDPRRQSVLSHDGVERPPSIPFMYTRTGSTTTVGSRGSRQYQKVPTGPSRDSIASRDTKRTSIAPSYHRDSYTEIPLHDPNSSRPASSSNRNSQTRPPKFTETWVPTDSLISRTNQRNREIAAAKTSAQNRSSKSYEALTPRYYNDDVSDDEYGDENIQIHNDNDETDLGGDLRPHPLRLNPTEMDRSTPPPRARTPYYHPLTNSLSEVSSNTRRVSAGHDIADEKPGLAPAKPSPLNRQSSIQKEDDFYSRPYGDLKSATPPVMVGNNRKVSSGNDFDSKYASAPYERRNVSGKVAEEGRGGAAGSRVSVYETRFGRD